MCEWNERNGAVKPMRNANLTKPNQTELSTQTLFHADSLSHGFFLLLLFGFFSLVHSTPWPHPVQCVQNYNSNVLPVLATTAAAVGSHLVIGKTWKKDFLVIESKSFHFSLSALLARCFFLSSLFCSIFLCIFLINVLLFRWWWWRWRCSCCYCCFFRALFHCKIVVQKEKWHKTSDPSEGTRPKAREQNLMLQRMCAARIMCTKSERLASYSSRHKKISFPPFLSLSRSRFVRQNVNPILSS